MVLALILWLAQAPLTGVWVGPLQLTVEHPEHARGYIPTSVEIAQNGTRLTGSWRALPPNTSSGTFAGTINDDDIRLRVLFYSDAAAPNDGVIPERCEADGDFSGRLTASGVIVLTATRLFPDKRPKRDCSAWPHDFVWVLQRH